MARTRGREDRGVVADAGGVQMRLSVGRAFRAIPIIAEAIGSGLRIRYLAIPYPRVRFGAGAFFGPREPHSRDGWRRNHTRRRNGDRRSLRRAGEGRTDPLGKRRIRRTGLRDRQPMGKSPSLIAEHVTIRDQDHEFESDRATADSGVRIAPIKIGDNV